MAQPSYPRRRGPGRAKGRDGVVRAQYPVAACPHCGLPISQGEPIGRAPEVEPPLWLHGECADGYRVKPF